MKVKELKKWLNQFNDNEEVIFTSMDDNFYCDNVGLHSPYDDGQAQEVKQMDIMTEDLQQTDLYVVYVQYWNGSISLYTKGLNTDYVFNKRQLTGVKNYLKKQGLGYKVYKVGLQLQEVVEDFTKSL